ncbi:hypothetical protein CFN78_21710 [Amycolatopsis antarctica]|uniref:OmpR/PhoB-type domain-containing protein n=1 Tax=Amycolatopsis antarctica TaxID=1854586 RepID=A0A263CYQ2_9PSEU|nr:BTAD domain-containing putative transcriptional regulator [Amycolatopsis antarctica]OZM71089.1 hypothetical protein CFN78_21710 [Amycolatopsis antarctica]
MQAEGSLSVRLIGAVAVMRDGVALPVDRPRQRAVLAALALRAGHSVRRDELVRAVWGQDPPRSAPGNVHTYVSGLRKVLGSPQVLRTEPDGYRFDVPARDVDALEFDRWADRATDAWAGDDGEACLAAVAEAARLWQGVPLPGVEGPFAEAERHKLDERWLTLRRLRAQALLASGRIAESLAESTSLAHAHPLDERVAMLRSRSLYCDGQVAEALAELDAFRRRLREEMGAKPGAELGRFYEQMLTGEVDSEHGGAGTAKPETPPTPAAGARAATRSGPAHLPHGPWGFVGRDNELAGLAPEPGLPLVISGHAGIGKSALALRLAHDHLERFPDGQLYVDLAGSLDSGAAPVAEVLDRQLLAFGVHVDDLPGAVDQKAARLRALLAARRVLVLFDDAADPEQLARLLPEGGNSAAIVTSRRRLSSLREVRSVPLTELSPASATELLADGCGNKLDVDPADPWLARAAAFCGHVPLALRVLAVRLAEAGADADAVRGFVNEQGDHEDPLEVLSPEGDGTGLSVLAGLEHAGASLSRDARTGLSRLSTRADQEFSFDTLRRTDPDWPGPSAEPSAVLDELLETCLLDRCGEDRYRLPNLVRTYGRRLARQPDSHDGGVL